MPGGDYDAEFQVDEISQKGMVVFRDEKITGSR
jgi:hypothetical protein